ncbi:hypothetical protein RXV95_12645 [Novosphingobium sp. ZN18A2]|uniref:hypothetical protein n=1 Tax=Novosphingobium sp. ZN18A2 TaxID=3079861 RepID=UPI0030CBF6A5
MAKRWDPQGKPVGPHERVGRRLFDLPELVGASEAQYYSRVKFTQFWDKQTGEVSLDRLGRANVEPKVRTYLLRRAEAQGGSFRPTRTFEGWAHIKAQDLTNAKYPPSVVIVASPMLKDEGAPEIKENIYHAHIPRPDDVYQLALHLRNLFEDAGSVEQLEGDDNSAGGPWNLLSKLRGLFERMMSAISSTED